MYLNLGKVKKKYEAESIDDFMIFSEIPNSQLSYEKPILVRTIDELHIWFGKDFDDIDYLEELINNNVTLYLYKPIEDQSFIVKDNINLDDYLEDDGVYAYPGSLPPEGDPEYKYWVGYYRNEELPEGVEEGCWYIWIDGNWYSEKNLPQNINNQSNSLNNRDTLIITKPIEDDNDGIIYSHPEFRIDETELGVYSRDYDLNWLNNRPLNINLDKNNEALALKLICDNEEQVLSPGDFVIITSMIDDVERQIVRGNKCLVFCESYPDTSIYSNLGRYYHISLGPIIHTLSDLKDVYRNLGYEVSGNLIYSSYPFSIEYLHLYNLTGITIEHSFGDTNNIITKYIDSNDLRCAEFWSRTIGRDSDLNDDKSLITISIEHVSDYIYNITVSRYNYEEVFEGSIKNTELGEERLDFIINKESKLIYCTFDDISDGLRTGTFTLRRAELEEQNEDMYWKSLEVMFDFNKDDVFPDYFLVPDKLKYIKQFKNDNTNYCKDYLKFLEYATTYNFQVLIENNSYTLEIVDEFPERYEKYVVYKKEDEEIYKLRGKDISSEEANSIIIDNNNNIFGGDFVYNYTKDRENKLIYFYNPMSVNRNKRPGYYLYLFGLLSNIFSIDEKHIIYYSPNPYPYKLKGDSEYNEFERREELLKGYKCNYLTCNNHSYYYKEYFSGDKPISSAWMRFVIGKTAREFYKHKWDLLTKIQRDLQNNINSILNRIINSFKLVKSIKIDSFNLDLLNNKLSMIISVYLSDLVSSNMTIDITLNFNNF